MATSTAKLLSEALELPRAERAELATQLLRSLDDEAELDLDEAARARELERRAAALADGTVELVPWEDFRAALHAQLKARRAAAGR
ncbi:MAG TPA: addiction module protein [Kofleriaceae bacterium]|nr:addiction module protein [Kofleriaceae bacterium]